MFKWSNVKNEEYEEYDLLLQVTDEAGKSDHYGVYILKVRKYV